VPLEVDDEAAHPLDRLHRDTQVTQVGLGGSGRGGGGPAATPRESGRYVPLADADMQREREIFEKRSGITAPSTA